MKIVFAFGILFLCSISAFAQTTIQFTDVGKHIGDSVVVCGKVICGRFLEKSKGVPAFFNLGEAFPNHTLTIVIWRHVSKQFETEPELQFKDKDMCVTGMVEMYKRKEQIAVRMRADVVIY